MWMENLVKLHITEVDWMYASMLTCCNAQLRNGFPLSTAGIPFWVYTHFCEQIKIKHFTLCAMQISHVFSVWSPWAWQKYFTPCLIYSTHSKKRDAEAKPTLYLFLQPGTGQAKGFSSPPFMHIELRMDSELMALSVVHDSSLSDSSKSTSSSSHSLPARGWKTESQTVIDSRPH